MVFARLTDHGECIAKYLSPLRSRFKIRKSAQLVIPAHFEVFIDCIIYQTSAERNLSCKQKITNESFCLLLRKWSRICAVLCSEMEANAISASLLQWVIMIWTCHMNENSPSHFCHMLISVFSAQVNYAHSFIEKKKHSLPTHPQLS